MQRLNLILLMLVLALVAFTQDRQQVLLADEYYQQGESEKALTIYRELADDQWSYPLIHKNYVDLLKSLDQFEEAEKFLKQINHDFPNNIQFQVALAALYNFSNEKDHLEKYLDQMMEHSANNPYQLAMIGQQLSNDQMNKQAIDFYAEARRLREDPSVHALELAMLYRAVGQKTKMIEEYLNYAASSPNRLNYVKNLLQNYLQEEEQLENLENVLLEKIQQDADNMLYAELMIWLELQRKNFYGAFIQARAIDKRNLTDGDRTLQIGQIALENKAFSDATDIFQYLIDTYPGGSNYAIARKLYLETREKNAKNSFPVDTLGIRELTREYYYFFKNLQPDPTAFEALRNKALLHAFYLEEIDSAKFFLDQIVTNPRIGGKLVAESKLDLGDLYLLQDEPWESSLLYSQVEKSFKSHPLGYEAKLRNARLNYFTGKFEMAKIHLDILKKNTTRDISNDAIALGMLITDNTALDTTDHVMQEFANTELLLFQNKKVEAKDKLESMLTQYEFHSITDEILWKLSEIELEFGNFVQSISWLDQILGDYSYDILADDAAFKKAEIYDFYLKSVEEAKNHYQQFLIDYPGSKYAAEARNRFRRLRGDFIN